MKKDRIIYWASTVALGFIMLFSMFKMYTPIYEHLGCLLPESPQY